MCGRYSLFVPADEIEARFDATFAGPFEPRYNAAPRQSLPTIADADPAVIGRMEWGLVPPWADSRDDAGFINARAETVAETASFREAFEASADRAGRCLVPADGFYEWVETDGGKRPYRVTRADGAPFAMAGLWTEWEPPSAQSGLGEFGGDGPAGPEPVRTFAVVTTEPNATVGELHHRMAAILPESREREWLTADTETAADLLEPYAGEMRAYRVSEAVNDPANDTPAVADPVDYTGRRKS